MNKKLFLILCISTSVIGMELEDWQLIEPEPVQQEKEQVMQTIKPVLFRPHAQTKGKDFPQEFKDIDGKILPVGWTNITEQRKSSLSAELASSIKQVLYYNSNKKLTEQELLNSPRLVLFLIHGTFSEKSPQFSNIEHPTMQSALRLAVNIEPQVNAIEVVTFGWAGQDSDDARLNGGKNLAAIINSLYQNQQFTKLYLLGHSHGGNVIKAASHEVNRSFERVYFIFTPVRSDRPEYTADMNKINQIMNFWSSGDSIQFVGSFERSRESFGRIFNRISEWSLADISSASWLRGGRKIVTDVHKKIINMRVQDDGKNPSHVEKVTLINYIATITSFINFFYTLNFDFDVNIDQKASDLAQAIYIVIRHPLHLADIPGIKTENEQAIKTITAELEKELTISEQEATRFKQKYKKEIGEKGWRISDYAREAKLLIFGH